VITRQLAEFSQPHPSLSGSLVADEHSGTCANEFAVTAEVARINSPMNFCAVLAVATVLNGRALFHRVGSRFYEKVGVGHVHGRQLFIAVI
jgi:hypothetical protein